MGCMTLEPRSSPFPNRITLLLALCVPIQRQVFPPDVDQAAVYDRVARNVVDSVLQGYNGTVFAYGQTGCACMNQY